MRRDEPRNVEKRQKLAKKIQKLLQYFVGKIILSIFALRMSEYIAIMMVRWMSGLVTGLQNRLQRFESASDLRDALQFVVHLFFVSIAHLIIGC